MKAGPRIAQLEQLIRELLEASNEEWEATIADNNKPTVATMERRHGALRKMAEARTRARLALVYNSQNKP